MATRIAKYEIKLAVDRHGRQSEDFQDDYGVNMQVYSQSANKDDGEDLQAAISGGPSDKLNEEIRKILMENHVWSNNRQLPHF